MNKLNIMPALTYNLRQSMRGALWFAGSVAAIMLGLIVLQAAVIDGVISTTFSGLEFGGFITCFIIGIVSIRESLRLFLQNGISRRTVAVSFFLDSIAMSLAFAIAGSILLAIFGRIVTAMDINASLINTYSMFIENDTNTRTVIHSMSSMLFSFTIYFLAMHLGQLISLIYYRLNRLFKVLVSILGGMLLFIGFPLNLLRFDIVLTKSFIDWLISGPGPVMLVFVVMAIVFSLLAWLLIRRAPLDR